MYILQQQHRVPIRIQSKKSCLRRTFLLKFCVWRILYPKKSCLYHNFFHTKSCIWGIWFHGSCLIMMMIAFITFKSSLVPLLEGLWSSNSWEFEVLIIHWYSKWFELKYSVVTTTKSVKKPIKKLSNNKPFVRTTSWDTNHTTPIQSRNSS